MKRIATIQDISCIGKCSLTVALPIISAMGIEAAVVPTAVLSTHTAFSEFTFRDLTEDIPQIAAHWKRENFRFDAIYTGYLGSIRQLDMVADFFDLFRGEDALTFVDPVLGDHGRLYAGFTPEFAEKMAEKLCSRADILVPNLTEACYLTGTDYDEAMTHSREKDLLKKLCDLGAKQVLLTGARRKDGEIGVLAYDSQKNEYFEYYNPCIPCIFHGTGDVFASCCVGAMVRGLSTADAMKLAADFVVEAIGKTLADGTAVWYGVNFEEALPMLIERMK